MMDIGIYAQNACRYLSGEEPVEVSERMLGSLVGIGREVARRHPHRRQQSGLRRELYEAHRLIDGILRRFPEMLAASRQKHGRPMLSGVRTQ